MTGDASTAESLPQPGSFSSRDSGDPSLGGTWTERGGLAGEVPVPNGGDYLERGGGARLFLREKVPGGISRGVVVVTHGLGEHSGRYGHVAEAFASRGLRVGMWDLRGHGRSSGYRGDAETYRVLIDDLEAVCLRFREAGKPLFLFGHSLGGQIVLRFLQERAPACGGAVIASPWLRLAFNPPWWKLALASLALRIWPRFPQKTGASWERLSRDFAHLASFPDLDLAHHVITARLYFAVREAGEAALADAGRLELPLFLVHGDDDPITCHRSTEELFQRAASQDKALRFLRGGRHETHNDLDRVMLLQEIGDWMGARLGEADNGAAKSE